MPRKDSTIRKSHSPQMDWHFRRLPFWERVEALTLKDVCHVFYGHRDEAGYGRMHPTNSKKMIRLHRAVWERDYGPIPNGKVVMHICDNRACINPDHLKLGTQTENIKDMFKKGRNRSMPYLCDVVF